MHLHLLRAARLLLKRMSEDQRVCADATPILFHPDLHKRNILVSENDPTVVTSIIDWQSTSVEPAFWFATTTPDFADIRDRVELLTEDGRPSKPDPEAVACAQAFDACLKFHLPILAQPRSLNEDFLRPFHYGYRSWKDGVVALRHDLLMISQKWKQLGFDEPCPVPVLEAKVILAHDKDYRLFEAAQKLRRQVTDYLNVSPEGWVPIDAWDRTQSQHRELFDSVLQGISSAETTDESEPVKTKEDLKAIWPFDL
jgi:Phosphotransferase enzyme family